MTRYYFTKNSKQFFLLMLFAIFKVGLIFAQSPIDIAETTLKIQGLSEETSYYGLSAGDQLIFNFKELNNKELKEIEIVELPSNSIFMDYKSISIESKKFQIARTGIYK